MVESGVNATHWQSTAVLDPLTLGIGGEQVGYSLIGLPGFYVVFR